MASRATATDCAIPVAAVKVGDEFVEYSPEAAAAIDWNKFAIYGSAKVQKCKDAACLQQTLIELFEPIAPTIRIALKGQAHRVRVPVRFEQVTDGIVARGEFPLRQSELGLQPFSVALGTLVVLDEMKVRFEIRAH